MTHDDANDAVTIRDGTPADAASALEVWRAANEARSGRPPVAAQAARSSRNLQHPEAFLLVAEQRGAVVGMALSLPARAEDGAGATVPGLCHIAMVFVAPGHWGRGLGGRIVDAVLERARERGYARAQLWTHATNARAQRLYERRGFARSGREKMDDAEERIWHYGREL